MKMQTEMDRPTNPRSSTKIAHFMGFNPACNRLKAKVMDRRRGAARRRRHLNREVIFKAATFITFKESRSTIQAHGITGKMNAFGSSSRPSRWTASRKMGTERATHKVGKLGFNPDGS